MMRKTLCSSLCTLSAVGLPTVVCLSIAMPVTAFAQEAQLGVNASTAGVETTASAPAPVAPVAPAQPEVVHHPVELGLYLGGLFAPDSHALGDPNTADNRAALLNGDLLKYQSVAAEFGVRAAWLPIRYIGLEGEALVAPTQDVDGGSANIFALRLHGILQYPTSAITPFVAVGGGAFWVDGEKLGEDSDNSFTIGVGAKIPLSDSLLARIDLRDNRLPKQTAADVQDWYEILFGLSWGLGGTKPPPPPPAPVDSDGDGLTDDIDQCPVAPANTPDGCPIPDTDADGVLDNVDQCPQEAGTLPNGCPDLDPDKDGVPLPADQCPDVVGIQPDGCPDPDPDKDGVPVPNDKCPDQPETVNGFEDADGCPDEVPEIVKKFTGVIKGITFDLGKSTIRKTSFALLDEAAKLLTDYPSLRLEISGHTDSLGNHDKNIALSAARAESVKEYLVAKGIDATRLVTRGAGPDEPIADNKTRVGQAQNRRIEFRILQ
jgi:outer membrane protein OmpA-like peptidoglycan-associated protein